jgi:hypothetical protein
MKRPAPASSHALALALAVGLLAWPAHGLIPLLAWGEDDAGRQAVWSLSGQLRDMLAV